MKAETDRAAGVDNAIAEYYEGIRDAIELLGLRSYAPSAGPGFDLPDLDPDIRAFYAASAVRVCDLESYKGCTLKLLDLMGNPRTRTTKTLPSLVIVARAVEHIRKTNRPVMILTPTSANKGTALMDAVLRALQLRLVPADRLTIGVVVPRGSLHKLWRSAMTEDPLLRARNPVFVYDGDDPEQVKAIAREFADRRGGELRTSTGVELWHTMELDNYRVADSVRAYFEADVFPPGPGHVRVHAHAVSSGFGLLGYDLGRRVLAARGLHGGTAAQFFLVQHLRTPDMVLSLRFGTFAQDNVPVYRFDPAAGLFVQDRDPTFPTAASDPSDCIDPTFYTRRPATSKAIDAIVAEQGGGGIVVSSHECLSRYEEIRARLSGTTVNLPDDPRLLREWAVAMAVTGVLNGIDRGLIPTGADVVVHGSGSYGTADFDPVEPGHTVPIRDADDMVETVFQSAGGRS